MHSQNLGQSVYSSFGIGEINEDGFLQNMSMGNTGQAYRNSGYINFMNPASYSSAEYTTFEAGAISNFKTSSLKGKDQNFNNSSFSHLGILFPISKKWGASMGLVPFSSVNYNFSESIFVDKTYAKSTYTGNGGLNKVFIGNAYKPFSFLSIGLNLSYLFGSINKEKLIEFPQNEGIKTTKIVDILSVGGLYFDYGVQITKQINSDFSLCFGVSGSAAQSIKSTRTRLTEVFSLDGMPDTVASTPSKSGKIDVPISIGAGISTNYKNKLSLGFDAKWGQWEKLQEMGQSLNLGNSFKIGAGAEYCNSTKQSDDILKKLKFRLGLSYNKSPIVINGHILTESSVHIGLGIPFPKQRYPRELLLGIIIGNRSAGNIELPVEQFYKISVGLSLSDKWFERRKFD